MSEPLTVYCIADCGCAGGQPAPCDFLPSCPRCQSGVSPEGLREALDAAILNVISYKASPPEYPGLALVPVPDIEQLERVRRAVRVNDHTPHDQDGEPVEGFPVCSVCGAIQTDHRRDRG